MSCDVAKTKCRLCGEIAVRKVLFFSDTGKSVNLKSIVFKICEICVEEDDELPKVSCRNCFEKLLRLNKNIQAFSESCKNAQKILEQQLNSKKRCRSGAEGSPISAEKFPKQACTMVSAAVRRSLVYNHPSDKQQPNLVGIRCLNTHSVDEKLVRQFFHY